VAQASSSSPALRGELADSRFVLWRRTRFPEQGYNVVADALDKSPVLFLFAGNSSTGSRRARTIWS